VGLSRPSEARKPTAQDRLDRLAFFATTFLPAFPPVFLAAFFADFLPTFLPGRFAFAVAFANRRRPPPAALPPKICSHPSAYLLELPTRMFNLQDDGPQGSRERLAALPRGRSWRSVGAAAGDQQQLVATAEQRCHLVPQCHLGGLPGRPDGEHRLVEHDPTPFRRIHPQPDAISRCQPGRQAELPSPDLLRPPRRRGRPGGGQIDRVEIAHGFTIETDVARRLLERLYFRLVMTRAAIAAARSTKPTAVRAASTLTGARYDHGKRPRVHR